MDFMNFKIVRILRQAEVAIQITRRSKGKNSYTSLTNARKAESPDECGHKNDDEIIQQNTRQARVLLGSKVDSDPDDRPCVDSF
ncbi:hypothetical protein PILCRDRAFT_826076 [Piloderma croceum F 1598]|uniref:Uncharacterized protein n=1 Tax=Piloderma croceum (strain F 1598) TaxID=765440 RepID=A0A0C3FAC3_PILCF|nr:hypothetical protein PILCRDRAFT_826076 [Piloderma croceum F 1598]